MTYPHALRELARRCEVVTFEHELVDLAPLRDLEAAGVTLRPGTVTPEVAVDKGADAIAHGATGKGNDQVRFELS